MDANPGMDLLAACHIQPVSGFADNKDALCLTNEYTRAVRRAPLIRKPKLTPAIHN